MAAGDDEDVHGRLGIQITEGDGVLRPVDDVGGEVTGDDTAEEAVTRGGVAHRVTLARRPLRRRPVTPSTRGRGARGSRGRSGTTR